MHDLLFPAWETPLTQVMISSPRSVSDKASLNELEEFFEEHHFFAVPVVDDQRRLVGVVLPNDVEEAGNKQKTKTFLRLSGIIGGEEFRTMPLFSRTGRRLSWLSLNIVLNIIAASVIALYQDTVILGGMLPLALKRLKLDPALVSGPLLTTVTDMCGFFFVLSFAAAILPKLGGM